jgi:hypothetical protein
MIRAALREAVVAAHIAVVSDMKAQGLDSFEIFCEMRIDSARIERALFFELGKVRSDLFFYRVFERIEIPLFRRSKRLPIPAFGGKESLMIDLVEAPALDIVEKIKGLALVFISKSVDQNILNTLSLLDVDFFVLFAGLVAYRATGLAGGLAAGLTLPAAGLVARRKGLFRNDLYMFHIRLRFYDGYYIIREGE